MIGSLIHLLWKRMVSTYYARKNIVLAHFASNVEVGNFGATWAFTSFMMILVYPITTSMFPMFSKMDPKDQRSDLSRGFVLAVKYTSLLMIPASVAVMLQWRVWSLLCRSLEP